MVARVLKRCLGGDHIARVEAGIEPVEPRQSAHQQARAHQQHKAERHLGDHQRRTGPAAPRPGDTAARFHQHGADVEARGLQCRREAEEQAGEERDR